MSLNEKIAIYQAAIKEAKRLDQMADAVNELAKAIVATGLDATTAEATIMRATSGNEIMASFLRREVSVEAARPCLVAHAKAAIEVVITRTSDPNAHNLPQFPTWVDEFAQHVGVIDPTLREVRRYIQRASNGVAVADARLTEAVANLLRYG